MKRSKLRRRYGHSYGVLNKRNAKPGVRVEVTEGSGLDSRRHGEIVDTRTFSSMLDGYHRRTLEQGWVIVKMDAGYMTTQPAHRLIKL
jgi:hypothetical protein